MHPRTGAVASLMTSQSLVTAVIVAYNSSERIIEALRATEATMAEIGGEVVVVDNASTDDTLELVRSSMTTARLLVSEKNLGFGGGANLGIAGARGEYVLVMCDHTRIEPDAVRRLIEVLESDGSIGAAGPMIVDGEGLSYYPGRRSFPGPAEEWERLRAMVTAATPDEIGVGVTDVSWLVGACVMLPTEVARRAGGFNPAFFVFGEDIDLGRRLVALGYRSVTVSDAIAYHPPDSEPDERHVALAKMKRRRDARVMYYRIWLPRWIRMLVYLRRALGLKHQPERLLYFARRVVYDGASLRHLRFPPAIDPDL